ncbi:MAG: hypothetical protein FJX47_01550 [Alphaproteobacteria bacterium]|nr:hypothetical protein [Alphaproteobacteria bacterium]
MADGVSLGTSVSRYKPSEPPRIGAAAALGRFALQVQEMGATDAVKREGGEGSPTPDKATVEKASKSLGPTAAHLGKKLDIVV